MKITEENIKKIHHFLEKSIFEYRMLNISSREIKILMPEILLTCFKSYFRVATEINQYMGIEVNQHYKDEVAVYYPYYFYNPELYAAKVLDIRLLIE